MAELVQPATMTDLNATDLKVEIHNLELSQLRSVAVVA
jgi:hypothetical protein